MGISIDSILSRDLDVLRARSRDLSENNEYFQKFLTMLKCNTVGDAGMTLKNKASEPLSFQNGELIPGKLDKLANKLIEDSWFEWGKKENCTVSKDLTLTQVQHLAVEEWGTCGETLWQFVYGPEADNKFGFALKPVVIDRLLTQQQYNSPNGNKIRLGVEKNDNFKTLRYWLTKTDPTDFIANVGKSYSAEGHDAKDFVHLFLKRRIGQSRGVPWAAAALMRIKMLAGYEEAVVDGSRAAACKMGFLTKTGTGVEYAGENADGGGKYMDAEPGLLEELPQGMDIKTVDWGLPGDQYGPFVSACIRGMACGLNVSYPNLANDYSSVNFSSGRMARMEETEFWKFCQAAFISDFIEPIFGKWLEFSLLNQAIIYPGSGKALPRSLFQKFNAPNFHGRRWGWVDPTKEVAALAEELRLKLNSHTRICAERGFDRDELFDEIADDKAAAEARGITIPDEAELAAAAQRLAEQQDKEPTDEPADRNGFHLNGNGRH